ncbi:MAG: SRPBCC family protein [Lachnospiraceae bacterium]
MKYQSEIIINCPMEKVIECYKNVPERILWKSGAEKSALKEVILEDHLPEFMTARYESDGFKNVSQDSFTSVDEDHTRFISKQEYRLDSGMMNAFSILMKRMFIRYTDESLLAFKQICENRS